MSIEKVLEVLKTPEADGGLSDSEKILAAIEILEEVQATPAPVSAPIAVSVEVPAPIVPVVEVTPATVTTPQV